MLLEKDTTTSTAITTVITTIIVTTAIVIIITRLIFKAIAFTIKITKIAIITAIKTIMGLEKVTQIQTQDFAESFLNWDYL